MKIERTMQVFFFLNKKIDREQKREEINLQVDAHRHWHLIEGLIFLIGGILALILPQLAVLAVEIVIGYLLLMWGIIRLINAIRISYWRWWYFVSGFILLGIGSSLIIWPQQGIEALVILLGCSLIAEGTLVTVFAIAFRPIFYWGWLLAAGLLDLFLGSLVFTIFPESGIMIIALLIGFGMAFYGLSLLMLLWRNKI